MDKIVFFCHELENARRDNLSHFAILNTLNEAFPDLLNEVKQELDSLDCEKIDTLDTIFATK